MAEADDQRLAAVLSADVVGYSQLIAEDEDAAVRTLGHYREQVGVLVRDHRGRLVDFTGDNFLAEFASARQAVLCAIEIQRVLKARNAVLPPGERMEFRIGAHLGDIRVEDGRLYGEGVNIAARLEALAESGGICLSATLYEQVRHRLELEVEDLGAQELKNIPDPVSAYRILLESEAAPAAPPRSKRGRLALVAALLAAAAVTALVTWWPLLPSGSRPSTGPVAIRSIAVLPLENLSQDEEQEYFADGLTEELTATLARIGALRVISRTSAMQYKGASKRKSLPEIARELNVEGVIEGSVRRAGPQVRITAQLIHAESDEHLWAATYTRELTDILALQSEVAEAIAEAVKLTLTPEERSQLASASRVNVNAHESYLKGRYFLGKGTADGNRQAVEHFEQAIREDPQFALAYAGLADAHSCDSCGSVPEETMENARAAAERALELDESLAEAHTALGVIQSLHEWDFAAGEIRFQRAMRLNPGHVRAHSMYAVVLYGMGRTDEAIEHLEMAQEIDPLSVSVAVRLGVLYGRQGDRVRALDQLARARELDPESSLPYLVQGLLDCEQGRFEGGIASLERARAMSASAPQVLGDLGYCYARAGRSRDAESLLVEIAELDPGSEIAPLGPALIQVGLEDHDEAFARLERAYELSATLLPTVLTDPRYEGLRADPRFADLLRRMGARRVRSGDAEAS